MHLKGKKRGKKRTGIFVKEEEIGVWLPKSDNPSRISSDFLLDGLFYTARDGSVARVVIETCVFELGNH